MKVAIFASSSDSIGESCLAAARRLGELLAERGATIVYGGTCSGVMYACAHAAHDAGGRVIGVVPTKLKNEAVAEDGVQLIFTENLAKRKSVMDELSDAAIVLPGGFGTLDELTEILVRKMVGEFFGPIVILNTNGFYDHLLSFLNEIINRRLTGYSVVPAHELFAVAATPLEAVDRLTMSF